MYLDAFIYSLIFLTFLALKAPHKQSSQIVRCDANKSLEICTLQSAPVLGIAEDGNFN